MLLRRIISHFRRQEWTAIFFDFLIVVVGVFIGIQVSNWNSYRQDRIAETKLYQHLFEEFSLIETELSQDCKNFQETVQSTGNLITALRDGREAETLPDIKHMLYRAAYFYELPSVAPAYVELVASGKLSDISDQNLRAALVRYGDKINRHEMRADAAIPVIVSPSSTYYSAVHWNVDPNTWNDPDTAIIDYDWDLLVTGAGELQSWIVFQADGEALCREILAEVQNLLDILGAESTGK